jgi:hypothetical protein
MNSNHPDINFMLGSWGYQPEDSGCDLCAGVPLAPESQSCDHRCDGCGRPMKCEPRDTKVNPEVYRLMAKANADAAIRAIHRGSEAEAWQYAKDAVTLCRMAEEAE